MPLIRSILHVLWMVVTVIPWALLVLVAAPFMSSTRIYWLCAGWLRLAVTGGTVILGIQNRVTGMENLPTGQTSACVLLVKHQSTWETFSMVTLMPHPLAYVFKKELLYVPFFGWAMSRMDMIHIDRSKRAEAFSKVVEQGRRLMSQGVWVIMFPEGTRNAGPEPGAFKGGLFHLARRRPDVELVPVYLENMNRILPKGELLAVPILGRVRFGVPVALGPEETREDFLIRCRMAVTALHGESEAS
jgi:1-acyl-sn-glycerol-3-phosphate acyltransferase